MLLTATPEQLGKESHFARLRLLDPDRFTDIDHFVQQEQGYRELADQAEALLADPESAMRSMICSIAMALDGCFFVILDMRLKASLIVKCVGSIGSRRRR